MIKSYQSIRIFQVVCPIWPNIPLSPDIPDIESEAGVSLHGFDIESTRGWGFHVLIRLIRQHFEECRLTRVVQSEEEDPILGHAGGGGRMHG